MLETRGWPGRGCTFPVTIWGLAAMTGVGAPCGEGTTRCSPLSLATALATRAGRTGSPSLIDEIVREDARRMLAEVLQAEVDAYIAVHAAERDGNGRRLVVRNGYHQPREVLTSAARSR